MTHLIELKDITKKYMMGTNEVSAVNGYRSPSTPGNL